MPMIDVPVAHREDHRDGVGVQPSRDEGERFGGLLVQPVGIVHQAQQRARAGTCRKERQSHKGDEEAVRCGGLLLQAEDAGERVTPG